MDEIFRRGTCRYFKKLTPIPDDQLLTLVKAGMQARAVRIWSLPFPITASSQALPEGLPQSSSS